MDDQHGPIFIAPTREWAESSAAASPRLGHESWVEPMKAGRRDDSPRDERAYAGPYQDEQLKEPARDDTRLRPGDAVPDAPARRDDAAPPRVAWPPGEEALPKSRSRFSRFLWLGLGLLVILAVIWFVTRGGHRPGGRLQTGGPMPVGTATVQKGDMPVILTGLGTVTPLATVTVMTQINGQLMEVGFREGQMVKKGDFLAQIDPRPYQVALEQAEAQLAKDTAALNSAEVDLRRYQILVRQNSIARQTAEDQLATVQQDQAVLKTDQAQIDTQKLNLVYCHIIAPVSGRVGLRQIDPGNYVQTTSSSGLVVITRLQPISVIFSMPEDDLTAVLPRLHAGATLSATVFDRTGAVKLDTGKLETIDNQIDTTTGTVKFRAIFDNEHGILFPNQFVNVQLLVDTVHGTNIVPSSAIERGAPGTFVYLVKPDHTVTVQKVTLGPADGLRQAVTKGLTPGETVVTDGADRLKEGAKVSVEGAAKGAKPGAAPQPASQPAGAQRHRKHAHGSGQSTP